MASIDVTLLQREIAAVKAAVELQSKLIGVEVSSQRLTNDDTSQKLSDTVGMNEKNDGRLSDKIDALEAHFDLRVSDLQRSVTSSAGDYRHELQLRDDQLRREIDLREKSFRSEQDVREKALEDKLVRIEGSVSGAVKEIKDFKLWMAGIGVAVVLAIMGANYTLIGSAQGIFDGGKTAQESQQRVDKLIHESLEQARQNKALLESLRAAQVPAVPIPKAP